jgi:type IV pilus assembly protein PilW
MVALLLGVVLTSGVISVFITSKSSYSLNNAIGQVQEAGRYALSTMEPIISMAGYSGCTSSVLGKKTYVNNLSGATSEPVYNFVDPVFGFEFTGTGVGGTAKDTTSGVPVVDTTASDWTPNISSAMQTAINPYSPVKYSDMFLVHEELSNPAVMISPYDDGTTISLYASTTTPPMTVGDIAVASSCQNIEAFQITGGTPGTPPGNGTVLHDTSGNPGNGTAWTKLFNNTGSSDTVGRAQTYLFFVGKGIDGGYSLYEASFGTGTGLLAVQEIVPGVENMQVLYGVDQFNGDPTPDNVPDAYVTADQVTDWTGVVAVRVALVARSDDGAIDKSMTPSAATGIQMLGVGFSDAMTYYPAADRRIHRYFVETMSIRNTLP